jgi:hypothetical protein
MIILAESNRILSKDNLNNPKFHMEPQKKKKNKNRMYKTEMFLFGKGKSKIKIPPMKLEKIFSNHILSGDNILSL